MARSEDPRTHWSLPYAISRFRQRLALGHGTDVDGTIERVADGASLTAENLWLLICSALLASIGLDLNSAAVIIGAMLISPLMGPILGVGMGLGITDRKLLQRSLRELAFATVFVIATSALYFLISPLASVTSELLARTRPTLLDVGVAFVGGVAGIVAGSRRRPSLALPGVAIATALMPPLCTVGFGLATGKWAFFFGALYLYSLNAVFIAVATLLVVRVLRFPRHEALSAAAQRRERQLVAMVTVIAILPSVYFLVTSVQQVREQRRIADFVHRQIDGPGRVAPQWSRDRTPDGDVLQVYVAGHPIERPRIDSLQQLLPRYGLTGVHLQIIQSDISADDLERLQGDVQRDILRATARAGAAQDSSERERMRADTLRLVSAAREVAAAFPQLVGVSYAARGNLLAGDSTRSPPVVYVTFARGTGATTRRTVLARAEATLRLRLQADSLRVLER